MKTSNGWRLQFVRVSFSITVESVEFPLKISFGLILASFARQSYIRWWRLPRLTFHYSFFLFNYMQDAFIQTSEALLVFLKQFKHPDSGIPQILEQSQVDIWEDGSCSAMAESFLMWHQSWRWIESLFVTCGNSAFYSLQHLIQGSGSHLHKLLHAFSGLNHVLLQQTAILKYLRTVRTLSSVEDANDPKGSVVIFMRMTKRVRG